MGAAWVALALAAAVLLGCGGAEARARKYKPGQTVKLYANKIGPYDNPTETYQYYSLP